ncbi:MAG: hypothetical protein Greene07142_967, partial [Parcubacteria group bacterium Greene0714_2]
NPPQSPFDKGEAATPSLVKERAGEGFVVLAIFKNLLVDNGLFEFGITSLMAIFSKNTTNSP